MIFTNNFYSLLINAFSRNINQARHISKDYNGNTNVEVPNDRATAMARTMFNTGSGTDSMPIPSGVGNNLVTESDLTSTNVFRDDAGYPAGEISRNVTSNNSHDIGMLILGSGTTAPTKDDYKLESFIGTDKLQCTNASNSINETIGSDTTNIVTRTWTFKNITEAPITVNEMGLICNSVRSNDIKIFLLAREVLASPVTIQPNDKYTFEVNLTVK